MQIPLELAFEGCEASDAVRAAIEHEIRQLEKHNHHITVMRQFRASAIFAVKLAVLISQPAMGSAGKASSRRITPALFTR